METGARALSTPEPPEEPRAAPGFLFTTRAGAGTPRPLPISMGAAHSYISTRAHIQHPRLAGGTPPSSAPLGHPRGPMGAPPSAPVAHALRRSKRGKGGLRVGGLAGCCRVHSFITGGRPAARDSAGGRLGQRPSSSCIDNSFNHSRVAAPLSLRVFHHRESGAQGRQQSDRRCWWGRQ